MDQNRAWEQHVFIFDKIKKKICHGIAAIRTKSQKSRSFQFYEKNNESSKKKIDEIGFWAYSDQKVNESNMVYPPKGDAKHIQ